MKVKNIRFIAVLLLLLASFGIYANTLSNGFVYDDHFQIEENPWLKEPGSIPRIFTSDAWGFDPHEKSNYYRPVMHLIFMAGYKFSDLNPLGYHLINIALHAGVVICVFFLSLVFFPGKNWLSLSVALLFALHPVHTEAIAWISGVTEVSYTFFLLLSLLCYIWAGQDRNWLYFLSPTFFIFAALSKEQALCLPVFLVTFDILFRQSPPHKIFTRILPFATIIAIYFLVRTQALGGFSPVNKHAELSGFQYVINVFPLFGKYLFMLVLPINLNAFHVLHPALSFFTPKILGSLFLAGIYFVIMVWAWKKEKVICFAMLLIATPLLPALYIPALGINAFAERYLYLPSVGIVLLYGVLLSRFERWNLKKTAVVITTVFALFFAYGTFTRNKIWQDDFILWKNTVQKSPDGAMPHYNLGLEYKKQGRIDLAIEHFNTAVTLVPVYAMARANLGAAYLEKGLTEEAIAQFQIALKLAPEMTNVYINLGTAYLVKELPVQAINAFKNALSLKPNDPRILIKLAIAYAKLEQFKHAVELGVKAVSLDPASADLYYNLAMIYLEAGLTTKAISYLEKVIRLEPPSPVVLDKLASAYYSIGNMKIGNKFREKADILRKQQP